MLITQAMPHPEHRLSYARSRSGLFRTPTPPRKAPAHGWKRTKTFYTKGIAHQKTRT